ncbi:putative outer membrane protein [Roseivirga ehrenbergii]|uniref:Cystatin domain-containing protein n=1 Tax=Roseivirga ehrenbergii (strain DSM 102268 / JCM 13514 / KCTC 12282 / NCIMB 14502 / KMM 6017) TaxID=279360 RepID=A0A150X8U1_ROSEK|nr:hypothetical protein [Roseivirga ehrenbergii]KYG75072.1 hypothetical protein MB14_07715 [Roseivirga ehrenbergii]TCL13568.1 putative outer membrane protein [Roseivirga ehrenbergii]
MSNSTNLVGAFSPYTCKMSAEAEGAFKEAVDGLLGVTYSPVAVSQQVVAGMNYKFFCNTQAATRYPNNGAAIVSVYKPLKGAAHITHIQEV